MNYIYRKLHR